MRRYRGSAVVAAAKKERESALTHSLFDEIAQFDSLAAQASLPWIDQQWVHKELFSTATVADLPRIRTLTDILSQQCALSSKTLVLCEEREAVLEELVAMGQPCIQGREHQCTEARHAALCGKMEELDHYTDGIIALVLRWRINLTYPLPFVYKGENYFLKMLSQHAPATPVALIASHIRSTCRIKPFMYQSPYDLTMPPSLLTHDREVLMGELQKQLDACEEMLGLAKSGLYAPVLKFRITRPHIPIYNKKWKERLVLCYAGARHDLLVALNATAATHIASQFVQGSERAQTIRYFRKWMEWLTRKKDKEKASKDYAHHIATQHLKTRFGDWLRLRSMQRTRLLGLNRILATSQMALTARCMRRWFLVHKGIMLFESMRKVVCLRYFRILHFRVMQKRMDALMLQRKRGDDGLGAMECLSMLRCDLQYLSAMVHLLPKQHAEVANQKGDFKSPASATGNVESTLPAHEPSSSSFEGDLASDSRAAAETEDDGGGNHPDLM